MKTIYKNLIWRTACFLMLVASVGVFVSCEDELDVDPISEYSSDIFFKTVTHADLAVKGVYDVFSAKTTYSQLLSMNYPLDNDVSYIRGTNITSNNREIGHYALTPSTSGLEDTWARLYKGINRANLAIQKIPEMDLYLNGTEEEIAALNQYLGEAKFLRAFIYFDLVRLWGDVPLLTKPTEASDVFLYHVQIEVKYMT